MTRSTHSETGELYVPLDVLCVIVDPPLSVHCSSEGFGETRRTGTDDDKTGRKDDSGLHKEGFLGLPTSGP